MRGTTWGITMVTSTLACPGPGDNFFAFAFLGQHGITDFETADTWIRGLDPYSRIAVQGTALLACLEYELHYGDVILTIEPVGPLQMFAG